MLATLAWFYDWALAEQNPAYRASATRPYGGGFLMSKEQLSLRGSVNDRGNPVKYMRLANFLDCHAAALPCSQ